MLPCLLKHEILLIGVQDQYGGHFGLDRGTVENAAKRVQNGARNVLEKN